MYHDERPHCQETNWMSWYELLHEPMVAKGHVVSTMEKPEELMSVGHLDETIERESIA